jgi:serine protease Do
MTMSTFPARGSYAVAATLATLLWATGAWGRELPDFTVLVEQHSAAVVNVSTVQRSGPTHPRLDIPNEQWDEFFRRFFGPEGRGGGPFAQPRSLGSGFIISGDGYVLTNNHVVEDAEIIRVRLNDRRELEARLVGADPRSDLALLKVEATDLPTVKLGHSADLKVGEWVLAIGSPFGFDHSVTAGIVSAIGRSLPNENNENYVPFIQTDVAINPGNSGGPLFNLDGEVVGINSQIYTRSGGFMGVSFAIPIDVAMDVVDQLKTHGQVSRGWLGVVIQEVNRELAESFGLKKPAGALVSRVTVGSPAAKAGLKEGDIIVEFNGQPIDLSADLPHIVGRTRAGSTATMVVMRDGKRQALEVVVGELPDADDRRLATGPAAAEPSRLGLAVEDLSDASRQRAGVDGGVLVLESTGPAAEAGIQQGDVITRINNREIDSVATFESVTNALPPGRSVPVLIVRGQAPTFLALRVPEE